MVVASIKPGSHMPATYLGTALDNARAYVNIYSRHIICPRHWPPACQRSWAEVRTSRFPYLALSHFPYLYLSAPALFSPAPSPINLETRNTSWWEGKWVTGLHRLLVWFWRSPCMIALQLDFWSNKGILKRFTSFVRCYRRFQINGFQQRLILY